MIEYNFETKVITVTGGLYEGNNFYTHIKNDWTHNDEYISYQFPVAAQTPTIFSLINNWTLEPSSLKYLRNFGLHTCTVDYCSINILTEKNKAYLYDIRILNYVLRYFNEDLSIIEVTIIGPFEYSIPQKLKSLEVLDRFYTDYDNVIEEYPELFI